ARPRQEAAGQARDQGGRVARQAGRDRARGGEEDIAQIVAAWTGVPVSRLVEEETSRLLRMEDELHKRMVGQDEAIITVSQAVRRARAGLKTPRRPIGSFIFLGPTGIGQTQLARALAEYLFDSEDALIKLDMPEFMERHT